MENLSEKEINDIGFYAINPKTGDGDMNIIENYQKQMAENHAKEIDKNFWLVVKQKPKWMPAFLYRAIIRELVEFQEHRLH